MASPLPNDAPIFPAWDRDALDKFAADSYTKLQQQNEAIEHLRLDLRTAMQLLRAEALKQKENHG